jgi:hypothetical protein
MSDEIDKHLNGYIYFLKTIKADSFIKIGSTKHPRNRYHSFSTLHVEKEDYSFKRVYKILSGDYDCYKIDEHLKQNGLLNHHNGNCGEEFYEYTDLNKTYEKFEEILNGLSVRFEEVNDIDELVATRYESTTKPSKIEILKTELEEATEQEKASKEVKKDKLEKDKLEINKWHNIQYQQDIIKLGVDRLNDINKFYLELATGAGKTFIVFNIIKHLKPDILYCLSPRVEINKQNVGKDNLCILNNEYSVFNLSTDTDITFFMHKKGKKIIIGCLNNMTHIINKTC